MTRNKQQKKQTPPPNNRTIENEYEDKTKAMELQLSKLQELVEEQKETISKKNQELLSFQQQQQEKE